MDSIRFEVLKSDLYTSTLCDDLLSVSFNVLSAVVVTALSLSLQKRKEN